MATRTEEGDHRPVRPEEDAACHGKRVPTTDSEVLAAQRDLALRRSPPVPGEFPTGPNAYWRMAEHQLGRELTPEELDVERTLWQSFAYSVQIGLAEDKKKNEDTEAALRLKKEKEEKLRKEAALRLEKKMEIAEAKWQVRSKVMANLALLSYKIRHPDSNYVLVDVLSTNSFMFYGVCCHMNFTARKEGEEYAPVERFFAEIRDEYEEHRTCSVVVKITDDLACIRYPQCGCLPDEDHLIHPVPDAVDAPPVVEGYDSDGEPLCPGYPYYE